MSQNTAKFKEPIWDSRNQDWDAPVARQVPVQTTYRLIEANTTSELESQVARAIANGWRPVGGIAVVPVVEVDARGYSHLTRYSQAMTK